LGNYATKIIDLLKKWYINLKCPINMYFVNVVEHAYTFFIVKSYQRPKVKEFKIIEVE